MKGIIEASIHRREIERKRIMTHVGLVPLTWAKPSSMLHLTQFSKQEIDHA